MHLLFARMRMDRSPFGAVMYSPSVLFWDHYYDRISFCILRFVYSNEDSYSLYTGIISQLAARSQISNSSDPSKVVVVGLSSRVALK